MSSFEYFKCLQFVCVSLNEKIIWLNDSLFIAFQAVVICGPIFIRELSYLRFFKDFLKIFT